MTKEVAILNRKLPVLIAGALGLTGLLLSFQGGAPVPVALAAGEENRYLDPGTCAQCHVEGSTDFADDRTRFVDRWLMQRS